MPLELAAPTRPMSGAALPGQWRAPLLQLAGTSLALIAFSAPEWAEMARQWWNASTYNHILLIPLILAWLVWLRWPQLCQLTPSHWWPGLAWGGLAAVVSIAGSAAEINLVKQAAAVMLLQAAVLTLLGPRVAFGLLFPLAYMAFLVPFGDEIVPLLQQVTAHIAIFLTHASGVPAQLDGVFIDTPVGLFEVAEACSGVKFLVAMLALGALAAHLGFASRARRAAFMLAAVIVPILANGVRAWGTIYIAQSQGVAFAAGFDHIVYGWIFFAIVMALLLGVAWRYFDRSPSDPLVDAHQLEESEWLAALARNRMTGQVAVMGLLLCGAAMLAGDVIAAQAAERSLAARAGQP